MRHINIPIFIPHIGCPNDCVFCNQKKITGKDTDVSVEQVKNIIESYFGVTSPLTFTFAKDVYRDVYTASLQLGKVRKKIMDALAPSLSEMLYQYEGKIYYNMRSWYHVNSVFPFKKSSSYMEGMMGVKSGSKQFKRVKMNWFDMLKLGVLLVQKLSQMDTLSDNFEKNFELKKQAEE